MDRLTALPNELLFQIVYYLDDGAPVRESFFENVPDTLLRDLRSLRLTCRLMEHVCFEFFGKTFFRSQGFWPELKSFSRLESIALSRFGCFVDELALSLFYLEDFVTLTNRHGVDGVEALCHTGQTYDNYIEYRRSQHTILRHDNGFTRLSSLFGTLRRANCTPKKLTVARKHAREFNRAFSLGTIITLGLYDGLSGYEWDGFFNAFNQAAILTNTYFSNLTITQCWSDLGSVISRTFNPQVFALTDLSLISEHSNVSGDFGWVASILEEIPLLRSFTISGEGGRWVRFGYHGAKLLAALQGSIPLRQLATLTLTEISLDSRDVTRILEQFPSIKDLKIHEVYLISGRWNDIIRLQRRDLNVEVRRCTFDSG